jgi:hypothetical protein
MKPKKAFPNAGSAFLYVANFKVEPGRSSPVLKGLSL